MPIPAYMWLKDDGGADIKGSATVEGREGTIEVIGFGHGLNIPVDHSSGKIVGTRSHSPMSIEKESTITHRDAAKRDAAPAYRM